VAQLMVFQSSSKAFDRPLDLCLFLLQLYSNGDFLMEDDGRWWNGMPKKYKKGAFIIEFKIGREKTLF